MGRRGPPSKGAAYPAGYGLTPLPITQEEAEASLGERVPEGIIAIPMPPETWVAICAAYHDLDGSRELLRAPTANQNPNDPDSHHVIRKRMLDRLLEGKPLPGHLFPDDPRKERVLFEMFTDQAGRAALHTKAEITEYKSDPDAFARRFDWQHLCRNDPNSIARALEIVEAAEPDSYPRKSPSKAKDVFIRRVRSVLAEAGLPTAIRGGGERPDDPTSFERLMMALGIEAASPKALSDRLRRALRG